MKSSYALIEKNNTVTRYQGVIHTLNTLDELAKLKKQHDTVLFLNPYSAIREKGYETQGNEPILALVVEERKTFQREEIIDSLPEDPINLVDEIQPSLTDEYFADLVAKLQQQEIVGGNATQVILSRIFRGQLQDFSEDMVLSIYRQLLRMRGQYMTLLFADYSDESNPRFFVGASPERHLEINEKETIMMPIAGTMRKGDMASFPTRIQAFLRDKKEINELFQVLDEEFKMMAKICPGGGKIEGPFLRESGTVVHTEYALIGHKSHLHPLEALKETLHAPTLVGGPMESAARIIARYEPESRRYYGGEIGILDGSTLDSAILIRCAEIDHAGQVRIQAGAGIVRDSDPAKEADETRAKAEGILRILRGEMPIMHSYLSESTLQYLQPTLEERNKHLSAFHFEDQSGLQTDPALKGLQITIINNEDNFTDVLGHMLRHIGAEVKIVDTLTFDPETDTGEIVVIGPGPGDVNDPHHPRMVRLRKVLQILHMQKRKLLGICLGHQALAQSLGIEVKKQPTCTQGLQREESVFGRTERLGFYNSFAPQAENLPDQLHADRDEMDCLITLSEGNCAGVQFHPESIMTENGYAILVECLLALKQNRHPSLIVE